jgi:NADPH2:quinone reductase
LLTGEKLAERIRTLAPYGVNHIVEVAFGANIKTDTEVLAQGSSIASYATNTPMPETPVWQLVFLNARLFFVGSDDVPVEAKIEATRDINKALEAGGRGWTRRHRTSSTREAAGLSRKLPYLAGR